MQYAGFNNHAVTILSGRREKHKLPTSYAEALAIYKQWAEKPRRRSNVSMLARNTQLREVGVGFAVRLHRTDIVTFHSDGSIVLDTAMYQTRTTRDRMNQCGIPIGMQAGIAYIHWNGREYTYADGMTLRAGRAPRYPDGLQVLRPDAARKARAASFRREKVEAAARKFGQAFGYIAWRWDCRAGGLAVHGNAPEAFARTELLG